MRTKKEGAQAVQFFFKHAGWSWNPQHETEREGRLRCARALAVAEQWARDRGVTFRWADDWDNTHDTHDKEQPQTCEWCEAVDPISGERASLGCIDDATDAYRRVIEAELAAEIIYRAASRSIALASSSVPYWTTCLLGTEHGHKEDATVSHPHQRGVAGGNTHLLPCGRTSRLEVEHHNADRRRCGHTRPRPAAHGGKGMALTHRDRIARINQGVASRAPLTWGTRHCAAYQRRPRHPVCLLIDAAAVYADAHQRRFESRIGDDGVLGPEWAQIVRGIRGLLNGELGALDGGTLDSILCDMLDAEGLEVDG